MVIKSELFDQFFSTYLFAWEFRFFNSIKGEVISKISYVCILFFKEVFDIIAFRCVVELTFPCLIVNIVRKETPGSKKLLRIPHKTSVNWQHVETLKIWRIIKVKDFFFLIWPTLHNTWRNTKPYMKGKVNQKKQCCCKDSISFLRMCFR